MIVKDIHGNRRHISPPPVTWNDNEQFIQNIYTYEMYKQNFALKTYS